MAMAKASNTKFDMERWAGRIALVTGASRGIGLAITQALLEAGLTVVAVTKQNIDALEELQRDAKVRQYRGTMVPMLCDISDLEEVKTLFSVIKSDPDLEGVDVCINNAAVAYGESFLSGNPANWKDMMDVNFMGSAYITNAAVKTMRDRDVNDGHIIFMNSLSGHRIIPGNKDLHMYSATKLALRSLLEGVRLELRAMGSGIRVSAISPGVVATDIFSALFEGDEEKAMAFLEERKYLNAEDIAQCVLFILSQPLHVQIHDIMLRSTEQIP